MIDEVFYFSVLLFCHKVFDVPLTGYSLLHTSFILFAAIAKALAVKKISSPFVVSLFPFPSTKPCCLV